MYDATAEMSVTVGRNALTIAVPSVLGGEHVIERTVFHQLN